MQGKIMALACCAALLLGGCATKQQKQLDAQLDQLCARDGGTKVYETVTLPPDLPLYVEITETTYLTNYKAAKRSSSSSYKRSASRGGPYTEQIPVTRIRKIINPDLFDPIFGSNALGPHYIWKNLSSSAREGESGDIKLHRIHFQLVRRQDKKLLGEIVTYLRQGNGVIWFSQYSCPIEGSLLDLLTGSHLVPAVFQDSSGSAQPKDNDDK